MSDLTQDTPQSLAFSLTGLSPAMAVLSRLVQLMFVNLKRSPITPMPKHWFGLFPFRSPLLWESRLIYLPQLLRCFSSLCNLSRLTSRVIRHDSDWVSPFGHPRLKAYLARSPGLFAACRVLHRRQKSRHPLSSLCNLFQTFTLYK